MSLAIIIIIFLPAFSSGIGRLITNPASIFNPNPITNPGLVSVTKPVQFTCFDALAGSNCGAVTVVIYQGSSSLQLESQTASASGVATTGNAYPTGTQFTLKVSGNSKVTEYLPFTVPGMDPNSALSNANNVVSIYAVTLGTWVQTNTGNNGATTFVSGSQYGLTSFTGSTTTVTTTITETAANAGYKSSFDITNLLWQYMTVEVNDGGGASSSTQYASITGFLRLNKLGNTNYYQVVCPDGLAGNGIGSAGAYKIATNAQSAGTADSICAGALSTQTIGNQVFGGAISFSWTVAVGSLIVGNVETFQIKLFDYYDPAYFAVNGNGGPNAAALGTTFTLKFNK